MINHASATGATPVTVSPTIIPHGGFVDVWIYATVTTPSASGTLTVTLSWTDDVQAQTKTYSVPITAKGGFLNVREPIYTVSASTVHVSASASGASAELAYNLHTLIL